MKQLAKAFLPLVLMVGCLLQAAAADSLKPQEQERVRTLIAGLGSASFADREQAAKDLLASGPLALAPLRAAVQNPDAEISVRAARLVAALEEQVLTDKMLAAKKVRLNVKDVSVIEAVDELARLSGYTLDVLGTDRAILSERKISLDTGDVTYWQAVQQLRQQGRLSEKILYPANNNTVYYTRRKTAFNSPMCNSRRCELRSCSRSMARSGSSRCAIRAPCASRPFRPRRSFRARPW